MNFAQILIYFLAPAAGYLLGAIPFAFLIGKAHGVDIRTTGSKNIGATNLGRTLGKKFFWQAFLLDAAKGFFPVLLVSLYIRHVPNSQFPSWSPLLTAIACVLGHNFPVYLKFRGGKGVATSFGAVLGFWPLYTLAAIGGALIFVFTLMIYRFISLASIVGVLAFFALVIILGNARQLPTFTTPDNLYPLAAIAALFAALIIFRHRANIVRLLNGTEPHVGQRERDKANLK